MLNTTNSMKEIAARYNEIAPVAIDEVKLAKRGKAKVLAMIAAIEATQVKKEEKPVVNNNKKKTVRTGAGAHIKELLTKVVGYDENGRSIGLSYDEVLKEVLAADERRNVSRNGIMWSACKLRSEGVVLPQIRPRKGK